MTREHKASIHEASNKSEIAVLDLSQNCITAAGANALFQSLRYNQTIVKLSLSNQDASYQNKIGAKGAKYLKELLQVNQVLNFLDLKGNSLCDQGIFQLSQGLKHNTGIMCLNLGQNGMQSFGVEFLKDALISNDKNSLVELDISQNTIEIQGVTYLS